MKTAAVVKILTGTVLRYVPIVLVALLAMATWVMVERARIQRNGTGLAVSPLKPDFIVDNLRVSKLDKTGAVQTLLSAQRMVHIPQTSTATLTEPRIMSFRPDSPPLSISARRGETIRQSEQINFYDDVVVQRAADAESPAMRLQTEQLQLRPDDDIASSNTDFTFERGATRLWGQGFELNNSFRTLVIRQQARGIFVQGNAP
ncbi:MAG: LPS export ABC transporter periplasmic protein LptC [Burkholderiales bacterium]|jgi:lipopolysaccharide export system protein LptC